MSRKTTLIIIVLENTTEKKEQKIIEHIKTHPKKKEIRKLTTNL